MFCLLMISIILLGVTVVMLLIREKQQDKRMNKFEEFISLLDKRADIASKRIDNLNEMVKPSQHFYLLEKQIVDKLRKEYVHRLVNNNDCESDKQ